MIHTIEITIHGTPTGKGRHRTTNRSGRAVAYTPAKTRRAEESVLAQALAQHKPARPMEGPIALVIAAHMPVPSSWSKRRRADALAQRILPTGRPDLDNVVKLVCDALNGVYWLDDAQIVRCYALKQYSDLPRTFIRITSLTVPAAAEEEEG